MIARLAGHRLVERLPRTHRYRLTPFGLRVARFLTKLADCVLDPGFARCGSPPPQGSIAAWSRFDAALRAILQCAAIAA